MNYTRATIKARHIIQCYSSLFVLLPFVSVISLPFNYVPFLSDTLRHKASTSLILRARCVELEHQGRSLTNLEKVYLPEQVSTDSWLEIRNFLPGMNSSKP